MKKNRVTFHCEVCGKLCEQKRYDYDRAKHHFCSQECKCAWQNKKIEAVCEVCGKVTMVKRTDYNRHIHHYCSPECSQKGTRLLHSEEKICEFCGKKFRKSLSSPQRFCSNECQHEWQKTRVGELSPKYSKVKVNCDWCGREYPIPRYRLRDFKNHFCSAECRRAWFANVWTQRDETKIASRERAVALLASGGISQTNSAPQKIVNEMLDTLGVRYVNEKPYNGFSMDNYLELYNLYIEVMGDFWHCSPIVYSEPIHEIQKNVIRRDKRKMDSVALNGDHVLYLWEKDVTNRRDVCMELVKLFVESKGILQDYHSFNYVLENGEIRMRKVAIPFQEQIEVA